MNSKFFLTGFMGSGKTYWGKRWAERNKLSFFDLDEQIENAAGETIANIFERKGEPFFREMEKKTLREFTDKNDFILACGGGTPCFFDNMEWMNRNGSTCYLQASPMYILNRIMNETDERPLLRKKNPEELIAFIQAKVNEREPYYKRAKYILDTSKLTIDSLQEIYKIKQPG